MKIILSNIPHNYEFNFEVPSIRQVSEFMVFRDMFYVRALCSRCGKEKTYLCGGGYFDGRMMNNDTAKAN